MPKKSEMKEVKMKLTLIIASSILCLFFAEITIRVYAIWNPLTLRSVDGDKKSTCVRFNKYAYHVAIPFCEGHRVIANVLKRHLIHCPIK